MWVDFCVRAGYILGMTETKYLNQYLDDTAAGQHLTPGSWVHRYVGRKWIGDTTDRLTRALDERVETGEVIKVKSVRGAVAYKRS